MCLSFFATEIFDSRENLQYTPVLAGIADRAKSGPRRDDLAGINWRRACNTHGIVKALFSRRPNDVEDGLLVADHVERRHVPRAVVELDGCPPFERVHVQTARSDYEVVVIDGAEGDVIVRGGAHCPEFRRARLAGATSPSGAPIKPNAIEVGRRLELVVDGSAIVTTPVQKVWHHVQDKPDDD